MGNSNLDQRLKFPATLRNRLCIAEVLENYIPKNGVILEIASGSGEHGVFFQKYFPFIEWQTSDPDQLHRKSIRAWIEHHDLLAIMTEPLNINVENRPWPLTTRCKTLIKGIVCINMIHISPWSCTKALFEEAKNILKRGQFLMLYGPFKRKGQTTCPSNLLFDQSLILQNSLWGLRDLDKVNDIAYKNGFAQDNLLEMPANNLSIIYRLN